MSHVIGRARKAGPRKSPIRTELLHVGACERAVHVYTRNLLAGTRLGTRRVQPWRQAASHQLVQRVISPRSSRGDADAQARLGAWMAREQGRLRAPVRPDAPLGRNLRLVARLVGLSPLELRVLDFLVVMSCCQELEELLDVAGNVTLVEASRIVAAAIAGPRVEVNRALAPGGRLSTSGLIEISRSRGTMEHKISVNERLLDVVQQPDLDAARVLDRLLPGAPASTLRADDYQHVAAAVRTAERLLAGALAARARGVNVLLWGATGTGKTELARLVAASLGVPLHVAGAADEDGESPTPRERLSSLMLGHRLLERARALLLFDEAEDIFEREWRFGGRGEKLAVSKQWFNLLLETNPVPTVWIANRICGLDAAFLRRFTYAIEFRPLGPGQRRRVWARHLGAGRPEAEIDLLAERFEVNAGQISGAVAAGTLMAGGAAPDLATLEELVTPLERLLVGRRSGAGAAARPARFVPELVSTPVNLERVLAAAQAWKPGDGPGLSLCLYGPPGTGKSAFVAHLARRMGRRLLVRKASDLLGPFVGETEQKIAEAFATAEAEDAVLLFDEVDSFLRDRRGASQRWEVTETNEMLQQLEAFPGVVACTTNLFEELDPAVLRRFVWKIPFRYLAPAQAEELFRLVLAPLAGGEALESGVLARLGNLTPGDFAAVERRHRALALAGVAPTARELAGDLAAECAAKRCSALTAGFRA